MGESSNIIVVNARAVSFRQDKKNRHSGTGQTMRCINQFGMVQVSYEIDICFVLPYRCLFARRFNSVSNCLKCFVAL
jgi:hypothetical protein